MILPNQIIGAISAALLEKYPDETVYDNFVPQGFKRPCFGVELVSMDMERDSASTVQVTAVAVIRAIVQESVHGHSHFDQLLLRQYAIMGLFATSRFPVEDRHLLVAKLEGDSGYDFANVTATFQWDEDVADFEEIETFDTVESVDIATSVKTE